MTDAVAEEIAEILSRWNPLGEKANSISDLDGYRTEAEDILFAARSILNAGSILAIVQDVLNQAFDLSLTKSECAGPAREIAAILKIH
jgi:hypothetical protein